jgi:MOSC domain-containing protein YiiM
MPAACDGIHRYRSVIQGYLLAKTSAAGQNRAVEHLSRERLTAGLSRICDSPRDGGRLILVVRRPAVGERDLPAEAVLDRVAGLVGDNWLARGSSGTPDGSADPQRQVTVMNARAAELVAGGTGRMSLAGDQLYLDLDLSLDNLPAGSLLAVGRAVLQVSEAPHLGCAKFVERFGAEAMRFVNSRVGRRLRLRGMNTRVVVPGTVRIGDLASKAPVRVLPGYPAARAQARTAATLRSMSSSLVFQQLTLNRIAFRPCQVVGPHQQVPSC